MGRVSALIIGVLAGSLCIVTTSRAQMVKDFVPEAELRAKIGSWSKAEATYLLIAYGKEIKIEVASAAAESLVKDYYRDDRKLSDEFKLDPAVARAVIHLDLYTVLNRSFQEAIVAKHKARAFFIAGLMSGKIRDILIELEHLGRALKKEDCHTIPCDPKLCSPTQCAQEAFKRFAQ
jgi:hypothetical protein